MKKIILLVAAAWACAAHADFNDGVVALLGGKYQEALQTFIPLAETSEHAFAQYFLARMYDNGQGVPQDREVAAKWYREAAEKGVGDAQYRLGALYDLGEGVPMDKEYAYGWYSVAAHLGNPKAEATLERARGQLSAEELVQAEKLARDLIQKYGTTPKTTARTK